MVMQFPNFDTRDGDRVNAVSVTWMRPTILHPCAYEGQVKQCMRERRAAYNTEAHRKAYAVAQGSRNVRSMQLLHSSCVFLYVCVCAGIFWGRAQAKVNIGGKPAFFEMQ